MSGMPSAKYFLKIKNASQNILRNFLISEVFNKNVTSLPPSTRRAEKGVGEKWIFSSSSRSFCYGYEAARIRVDSAIDLGPADTEQNVH
jgi:hypothetical protein